MEWKRKKRIANEQTFKLAGKTMLDDLLIYARTITTQVVHFDSRKL